MVREGASVIERAVGRAAGVAARLLAPHERETNMVRRVIERGNREVDTGQNGKRRGGGGGGGRNPCQQWVERMFSAFLTLHTHTHT